MDVRIRDDLSIEELRAGQMVTIEGDRMKFFGIVTDLKLRSTEPELSQEPPMPGESLSQQVMRGTIAYCTLQVRPMLSVSKDRSLSDGAVQTVKTIPAHFATVHTVSDEDVRLIFGSEDDAPVGRFFPIGYLRDNDVPLCLDLGKILKRSVGVFGKTGTGKTFLTRLLLSGIVNWTKQKHSDRVVLLVFDMHNEYGHQALDKDAEGGKRQVKGLAELFGTQSVAIYTLDPRSPQKASLSPHIVGPVFIPFSSIGADDVALLRTELALTDQGVTTAYLLESCFGSEWLSRLLSVCGDDDLRELADATRSHYQALSALHRKLSRLKSLPFLTEDERKDSVSEIMSKLTRGIHVVLEFGRQSSPLAYLLVANILTRKIHDQYVKMTEEFIQTGDLSREPYQLVLVVEEAHKFLDPSVSSQTAFGGIAREMRKYYVTLLIVDQRPSQIDGEVLSQIGTRLIGQLTDERDIQAVLAGLPGSSGLRNVLASLEPQRQALIVGYGVPMPVVVQARHYGKEFYDWLDRLRGREIETMTDRVDLSVSAEDPWTNVYGP